MQITHKDNPITIIHPSDMTEEEALIYAQEEIALWDEKGKKLAKIVLELDMDSVIIQGFERSSIRRLRRITGYIMDTDNWNDAKLAELKDRKPSI